MYLTSKNPLKPSELTAAGHEHLLDCMHSPPYGLPKFKVPDQHYALCQNSLARSGSLN